MKLLGHDLGSLYVDRRITITTSPHLPIRLASLTTHILETESLVLLAEFLHEHHERILLPASLIPTRTIVATRFGHYILNVDLNP